MDRADHLEWAKNRALEYVEEGELDQALTSFMSDLNKHPQLGPQHFPTIKLGLQLLLSGHLETKEKMRDWINGFN